MKILQVSEGQVKKSPMATACEVVVRNISKHLHELGHDVVILDRRYSVQDPATEYVSGVKVVRLNVKRIPIPRFPLLSFLLHELNQFLFAFKVSSYLAENAENFDVVHFHITSAGLTLVLLNRRLRERMIYTNHLNLWGSELISGMMPKITLILDSVVMRRVGRVTTTSRALKEKIVSKGRVKPARIAVVHEGTDADLFNTGSDADELRRKYSLNGKFVVLFVGRLLKIKGVEYLIRAADILVNDWGYQQIKFVIVGPYRASEDITQSLNMKELLEFINNNQLGENVVFPGWVHLSELVQLYAACDVFVLPSFAEIWGLVITEAMASGKPVIGTRVGAIPEQIRDGWNGFLIDPGDEHQLADKIKFLIDNPMERERMGINSRRLVEEKFSWSKVVEELVKVYSGEL